MNVRLQRVSWNSLFIAALFLPQVVCAQEEATTTSVEETAEVTAEQEAAAIARQNEEQEIASKVIPFVSGFAFQGLDPEDVSSAGVFVIDGQGRAGLAKGKLNGDKGNYKFAGTNLPGAAEGWLNQPVNRIFAIGLFKWIALSAVIGWPFVAFVLRGTMYVNDKHDPTMGGVFFRFVGWVANLLVILTMGGLYLLAIRRPELWPGAPDVELTHLFPLICGLGITTALGLLGSFVAWTKGYWRIPARMHYTVTIVSAIAFLYYLYHTDLIPHFLR